MLVPLPDKPGWLEQEEYEERTSVGFHLGRLAKRVGELTPAAFALAARQGVGEEWSAPYVGNRRVRVHRVGSRKRGDDFESLFEFLRNAR